MRVWSFSFEKSEEKEYNAAKEAFIEVFKDSEDYKKKHIILGCATDKDGSYKIFLSVDDLAAGVYSLSFANAFDSVLKNIFFVTKSDCKDINVVLPIKCKINSWYEEEKE